MCHQNEDRKERVVGDDDWSTQKSRYEGEREVCRNNHGRSVKLVMHPPPHSFRSCALVSGPHPLGCSCTCARVDHGAMISCFCWWLKRRISVRRLCKDEGRVHSSMVQNHLVRHSSQARCHIVLPNEVDRGLHVVGCITGPGRCNACCQGVVACCASASAGVDRTRQERDGTRSVYPGPTGFSRTHGPGDE